MIYLKYKILKSFPVYPTTPDEIIKIMKSFSNNNSSSPNSLPTPKLNNRAYVLRQYHTWQILPLQLKIFQSLIKQQSLYHYFKNVIPLTVLIIDSYRYIFPQSVKHLKNGFTSMFTFFLRKIILFLSVSLAQVKLFF